MIDVAKNHAILTATVESPEAAQLLQDAYVRDTHFGSLRFGWSVITLVAWLQVRVYTRNEELFKILRSEVAQSTKVTKLFNLAKKATVKQNVSLPLVVGGNIVYPVSESFTRVDMEKAVGLLIGNNFTSALSKIACSLQGINKLCAYSPQKLAGLIDLIDFPIPSICQLLQVLGANYVVSQPYLADGVIVSKSGSRDDCLCVMYGPSLKKYKLIKPSDLLDLSMRRLLTRPLSIIEAVTSGIETNDLES